MWALGILVVWLSLVVAVSVLAARWARRVWRRRSGLGLAAMVLGVAVAVPIAVGLLGTLWALLRVFMALGSESVEPSAKARALGEGISQAMNCGALALIVGVPVLLVAAVVSMRRES